MSKGSGIRRESDTLVRIDDDIEKSFDENARFEILGSTNNARFSKNGKKLLYDGSGSVTIRMKVRDKQKILVLLSLRSKLVARYGRENGKRNGMLQVRVDSSVNI